MIRPMTSRTHPMTRALFTCVGDRPCRVPRDANLTKPLGEISSHSPPPKNQARERKLTKRSKLIRAIEYQSLVSSRQSPGGLVGRPALCALCGSWVSNGPLAFGIRPNPLRQTCQALRASSPSAKRFLNFIFKIAQWYPEADRVSRAPRLG